MGTKRIAALAALFVVTATAGHFVALDMIPRREMGAAMDIMGRKGERLNQWIHARRAGAHSRTVVRPSPDLAYSICVYDLSRGPVRITTAGWDDYMSLSLYADNGDNYFVVNDRQSPQGVDLVLIRKGEPRPSGPLMVVESPSTRGVAAQRRLAPSETRFADADAARQGDVCAPL